MARLRPLFAAAALVALAACTGMPFSPASGPLVGDGNTFSMHPGGTVTLADHSTLHYVQLVADSRCPPQAYCIWAGDAELAFQWRSASGAVDAFSLHTGKGDSSHALGGRTLTVMEVERNLAPEAQLRIAR